MQRGTVMRPANLVLVVGAALLYVVLRRPSLSYPSRQFPPLWQMHELSALPSLVGDKCEPAPSVRSSMSKGDRAARSSGAPSRRVRWGELQSELLSLPPSPVRCSKRADHPVVCKDCCLSGSGDHIQVLFHTANAEDEGEFGQLQYPVVPKARTTLSLQRSVLGPDVTRRFAYIPGTTQLQQATHENDVMFSLMTVLNALNTQHAIGQLPVPNTTVLPRPFRVTYPRTHVLASEFRHLLGGVAGVAVFGSMLPKAETVCFERLVLGECLVEGLQADSVPYTDLEFNPAVMMLRTRVLGRLGLGGPRVGKVARVLLLSRPPNGPGGRHMVNEREVRTMLTEEGLQVKVLDLDQCNHPADRFGLFHWPDMVIGVHSAALANVLFCRDSAVVVELWMHNVVRVTNKFLAEAFQLRYEPVLSTEEQCVRNQRSDSWPEDSQRHFRDRDLVVDVGALREIVRRYTR